MLGLKELRLRRYSKECLVCFHINVRGPKSRLAPQQVNLGPLCCTIIKVTLVFPQVWNQTEPEPAADSLLSLCFLKTAGVWVPPMYLWALGPIYLLYIHRQDKGYLRMSSLFKTKMVATASGSLEPDNGWGGGEERAGTWQRPQSGHSSHPGAHGGWGTRRELNQTEQHSTGYRGKLSGTRFTQTDG